jgi:hypothetical protein
MACCASGSGGGSNGLADMKKTMAKCKKSAQGLSAEDMVRSSSLNYNYIY